MADDSDQRKIPVEQYRRRIANLLARGAVACVPRKLTDKFCLALAVAGAFRAEQAYSEQDVNGQIQRWLARHDPEGMLDHVTLRRLLVDLGFLTRGQGGRIYELDGGGPGFAAFDPEALTVDTDELLRVEREEAEARRAQFTQDR
jgi:hypothetical protein